MNDDIVWLPGQHDFKVIPRGEKPRQDATPERPTPPSREETEPPAKGDVHPPLPGSTTVA